MGKACKGITEDTSCMYHIPCDCFTHRSTKYSYSWEQKQQDFSRTFISSTSPTAPGSAVLHSADAGSMSRLLVSSQYLFIANLLPFSLLSTRHRYLFILMRVHINTSLWTHHSEKHLSAFIFTCWTSQILDLSLLFTKKRMILRALPSVQCIKTYLFLFLFSFAFKGMLSTMTLIFASVVQSPAAGQLANTLRPPHRLSDHQVTNSSL